MGAEWKKFRYEFSCTRCEENSISLFAVEACSRDGAVREELIRHCGTCDMLGLAKGEDQRFVPTGRKRSLAEQEIVPVRPEYL